VLRGLLAGGRTLVTIALSRPGLEFDAMGGGPADSGLWLSLFVVWIKQVSKP